MRIISKFQDFYDSLLAHGHDDAVVYIRHTTEYEFADQELAKQHPQIIRDVHALLIRMRSKDADTAFSDNTWRRWFSRHDTITGFQTKTDTYTFSSIGVLFCGKYYPGLRCERFSKNNTGNNSTLWFYDPQEVINFMAEHGVNAEKKTRSKFSKRTTANVIRDFFNVNQPDVNWLIEHKVTCIVFDARCNKVIVNPRLKDYEFFRVVDHYSAFQEIDMWVSGTLAWPQNMMIEIDDKYRIIAHGFDEQYGFRKRPQ